MQRIPSLEQSSALAAHVFTLPEILPDNARLLIDAKTNAAILLRWAGTELAASHHSFQLTPSAVRVFWALLQAYPTFCSYRSLFLTLYPLSQEQEAARIWSQQLALRPIRRALVTLLPVLHSLGLRVVSLRGEGYILAALNDPKEVIREGA